jgi:hypothetical protein
MPAPDAGIEDLSGKIVKGARAERRQLAKAAKEHKPDPTEAARIDSFCETMLRTGRCADALDWITSKKHNVGELRRAKSLKLVEKLVRAGAKHLYACDIDQYDNDEENTGHLVIELPDSPTERRTILREVDRLAAKQGYRGDFENYQRYAYVKLD